jgi:2-amino-4-hydroxy-6-hydroxymethyldihydropteridine diphosphokinase
MPAVVIALGSNLGDKAGNLRRALRELPRIVSVRRQSRVHRTAPAYITGQPDFLNMAVVGETRLPPRALLRALKRIERRLGRKPTVRFGPRPIDLDIIYYGGLVLKTPDLTIPHARVAERRFVLEPLAEVAPCWRHAATHRTAVEMISKINGKY